VKPSAAPATLALALALALPVTGCSTASVKLDGPLGEGAASYPVTGANPRVWGAPLAFGPWRTTWLDDATTRGWSFEVLGLGGAAAKKRPFALRLEGPAGAIDVECLQQQMEVLAPFGVSLDLEKVSGRPVLACGLRPQGSRPGDWANAWTLILRASDGLVTSYEGELRNARGVSFAVRSTHALTGSKLPTGFPVAYHFDRDATPAATVEVLNAGRVVIARGEREAVALAGASAALLLFEADP
jgi:hypothetical protein